MAFSEYMNFINKLLSGLIIIQLKQRNRKYWNVKKIKKFKSVYKYLQLLNQKWDSNRSEESNHWHATNYLKVYVREGNFDPDNDDHSQNKG